MPVSSIAYIGTSRWRRHRAKSKPDYQGGLDLAPRRLQCDVTEDIASATDWHHVEVDAEAKLNLTFRELQVWPRVAANVAPGGPGPDNSQRGI